MGCTQLPAELGGRSKAAQGLTDRCFPLEPLSLERGNRVLQMIGELRSHLGHVASRQRERSGDSIQVGGYRVLAIRPGSDPGVWVSRPDAESAFTAPNQPDRGDQEGSAASNPRDGSGPVDRHWFGPPTAWPMPSEKAAHS